MEETREASRMPNGHPARFAEVLRRAAPCLHNADKPLEGYGLNDWISLVLWLDKASVLLPLASQGLHSPYEAANSIAAGKVVGHRAGQRRIVDGLCGFAERAHKEKLRFVALKGAPLAQSRYGSTWARHYTDIDVFVSADDVAKADYVARECRFEQPAEYFSLRDSGALAEPKASDWLRAPFVIRRRLDVDTLSEYVAVDGGEPLVLDVHDRIGGLDPRAVEPFLWSTKRICLDGVEMNTLSDAATVAYLAMAAFDDSEGYRPNSTGGFLGFKLYCDLLACLLAFDERAVSEGFSLLKSLGKEREAGVVLSNLEDVFPGCADSMPFERSRSNWGASYKTRLIDVPARKEGAARRVAMLVAGSEGSYRLGSRGIGSLRWNVPSGPALNCEVSFVDGWVSAVWDVPRSIAVDFECFVFQLRLYPGDLRTEVSEIRINLFCENGTFECFAQTSARFSRSGRADKGCDGARCRVATEAHGDGGGLTVRVGIEKAAIGIGDDLAADMSINGGIYKNHYGRIYHELWRDRMKINGSPAAMSPWDC